MIPIRWLPGLAVVLSPAATAQSASSALDIGGFCAAIESKVLDIPPSHPLTTYMYQAMLVRAAGVQQSDDAEALGRKVRAVLDAQMPRLVCNTINFNPRNGSILKLAVARQNTSFINDVLRWKVALNLVDTTDGKTVLDYIRDRRDAALANSIGKPSSFAATMDRYYRKFRAAGALHRSELTTAPSG